MEESIEDIEKEQANFFVEAKNRRMKRTDESKYEHAVKTIISLFKVRKDKSNDDFSTDYSHFNFEDSDKKFNLFRDYMEELKEKKCFHDFSWFRHPYKTELHFEEINLNNLKKVRDCKDISNDVLSIQLKKHNKLSFYNETGDIEYNTETGIAKNGNKDYALLLLLSKNKNTPFTAKDIQEYCNSLVNKNTHKFKGEKDIDDTIRQIRFKLKVKTGAYFPILKRGAKESRSWIWLEK